MYPPVRGSAWTALRPTNRVRSRRAQRRKASLARARRQTRRPDDAIQQIYRGEVDGGDLGSPALQRIYLAFASVENQPEVREAFLRLLLHVRRHARLHSAEPAVQHLGYQRGNSLIEGLLGLKGCREGLTINPQLPSHWNEAKATRWFRGAELRVHIQRDSTIDSIRVTCNEKPLSDTVVRGISAGSVYNISVLVP